MIAASVIHHIQQLLAEGASSQRRIARLTGISRGTIAAIAKGRRRPHEPRADEEEPLGPIERCPGCGAMVHMPCHACRIQQRKFKPRRGRQVVENTKEPLLRLQLRPEHEVRYRQVRAWREEVGFVEEDPRTSIAIFGAKDHA